MRGLMMCRSRRDAGGQIIRSYGVLTHIHDRRRAVRRLRRAMRAQQDALRASACRMREIVDRVPGLVHTMTPAGEVELVNHRIAVSRCNSPVGGARRRRVHRARGSDERSQARAGARRTLVHRIQRHTAPRVSAGQW
jgi:hypothetical protein